MRLLRRLLAREPVAEGPSVAGPEVRPLGTIASFDRPLETPQAIAASPGYAAALRYFANYPARSFMSDHSRALLYSLVRLMRPKLVAEIGTLHAGTTEVFARALWENGDGIVHTTDPYGENRCPAIIAAWPADLQKHVQFHARSSMDFFARMLLDSRTFDLVLIDGNHDYEFALFDLQLAARLIQPNGLVVLDNAEQAGPFKAARLFLEQNPSWSEVGEAIAHYDPGNPFRRDLTSVPDTSFLLLRAPGHLAIGEGPHSWGQRWIDRPSLAGFDWSIMAAAHGTLHYHVYLRGFADGNRWVEEVRQSGSLRIDTAAGGGHVQHRFERPMSVVAPPGATDALFTLELDLSWQADHGAVPLALEALPRPLD